MKPLTVLLLIPTGIGASIGGYAGDGIPIARLLSGVADCLITHPNVLNGAILSWPLPNVLYVEGYALDRWCAGEWALRPVHRNRVGVLLDCALDPEQRVHHLNAIEAARWTLGIDVCGHCTTDAPVGVEVCTGTTGSWGTVRDPATLLRGAERLVAAGAEAIAVVTRFPDLESDAYLEGRGVDPIGGAEAVISHLLVRHLGIPCAHAPALDPQIEATLVHPRVAAESLGPTFLPCVLVGLSRAPHYLPSDRARSTDISAEHVDVVITPVDACGGAGLIALAGRGAPVIVAVEENTSYMNVTPEALGIKALRVRSYLEACGWLVGWKNGLSLTTGASCPEIF